MKRKIVAPKSKSKQSTDNDKIISNTLPSPDLPQNFSFTSSLHNEPAEPHVPSQIQSQLHSQPDPQLQSRTQSQMHEMQPALLPLPPSHPSITNNSNQYSHAINLVPQTQAMYHHHPGLDVSQNWPLDLVQGTHHYSQVSKKSNTLFNLW